MVISTRGRLLVVCCGLRLQRCAHRQRCPMNASQLSRRSSPGSARVSEWVGPRRRESGCRWTRDLRLELVLQTPSGSAAKESAHCAQTLSIHVLQFMYGTDRIRDLAVRNSVSLAISFFLRVRMCSCVWSPRVCD